MKSGLRSQGLCSGQEVLPPHSPADENLLSCTLIQKHLRGTFALIRRRGANASRAEPYGITKTKQFNKILGVGRKLRAHDKKLDGSPSSFPAMAADLKRNTLLWIEVGSRTNKKVSSMKCISAARV
eukprot:1195861-Prorocentrum_minimum.AAC.5